MPRLLSYRRKDTEYYTVYNRLDCLVILTTNRNLAVRIYRELCASTTKDLWVRVES